MSDQGGGAPPPIKLSGKVLKRAYENALGVVDRDAEILDQMRSRASILLAALAIGGAILGAILASETHPQLPWWVVVPLVVAIVLCVFVLWSTRDYGRLTPPVRKKRRTTKQQATSVASDRSAAIAEAEIRARNADRAAGRLSAAAEALNTEDLATIRMQARVAAAALNRIRELSQDRSEADAAALSPLVADYVNAAKAAIGRAHRASEALIVAASRAHDHAVTAADALEHGWRRSTRRARRGWQRFIRPWTEWFQALVEGDQRLWKTRLNKDDIFAARRGATRRGGPIGPR
jgi:hypothetical protein